MSHQYLINTCIFEQFQGLLFSDLSGPLTCTVEDIDTYQYFTVTLNY